MNPKAVIRLTKLGYHQNVVRKAMHCGSSDVLQHLAAKHADTLPHECLRGVTVTRGDDTPIPSLPTAIQCQLGAIARIAASGTSSTAG